MKKLLATLLALVMLCGLTPAFAQESYTLELWIAGNDDSLYAAYETVINEYMAKNPGVKVNMNMTSWAEYFTKLSTSFVGGTGPDVFALGFAQFYTLAGNGNMLNIAPYIPADWDGYGDIAENILNLGRLEGDIHALLVPEGRCLYYRKDIAAEQGLTEADFVIETVDDLVELSKKMTIKEGDDVIVEGLELVTLPANSPEQQTFIFGQMEGAKTLWADDLAPLFAEEPYVNALNKMKALLDEGYGILQSAGISYFNTDVASMSVAAQTGIEGASMPAISALGGEIGVAKLPNNVLLGQWYAVNKDSKLPAEAADLLLYLFSTEAQTSLLNATGQFPSRASLAELYCADNPMREVYFEAVQEAAAYGNVANPYFLTWVNAYRTAVEAVYAGTQTAQESMDAFSIAYKEACGLK